MPCPSQTWSLSDSQYPAQHSCSCALGTSLALTGQGKQCWCPLEGQQVTAWCAESENRVLSFPVLGYAHVLQVLCNPVGKFAQWGHFWEFRSQLKVSVAGDLMRFCHLVASVPASSKDCSVQSQPQGTIVFLVPRDKLAVVAAVEGLFQEPLEQDPSSLWSAVFSILSCLSCIPGVLQWHPGVRGEEDPGYLHKGGGEMHPENQNWRPSSGRYADGSPHQSAPPESCAGLYQAGEGAGEIVMLPCDCPEMSLLDKHSQLLSCPVPSHIAGFFGCF